MHSFTDTNRVKDLINKREWEWDIEAGSAALKKNNALTHFTVEWTCATPDPPIPKSASVYACEKSPFFSLSH